MFKANVNAKSNRLDHDALDRIFMPTEAGKCPWDVEAETVYERTEKDKGLEGITMESWVGLWIKYFNTDTMAAFRDLVLIGYCGQMRDAINLVRFRPKDVHGVTKSRKVFNCLVISALQDVSSSFLNAFIQSEHDIKSDQPRTVVRMIKEKSPSDKKETVRYLMLTEVPASDIESGELFADSEMIGKTDLVVYLYQAEDREQVDFMKRANDLVKQCPLFDLIPQIMLNVNLSDHKDEQMEAHRSILGQQCAQELGLKLAKELTNENMKEVLEAILMTVTEPFRGLSDAKLEIAGSMQDQETTGWFPEDTMMIVTVLGIVVAGVSAAAWYYLKHRH
jgi:hypothetical protein